MSEGCKKSGSSKFLSVVFSCVFYVILGIGLISLIYRYEVNQRPESSMFFKYNAVPGCSECGWISADGVIETNTVEEFKRFLAKYSSLPVKTIRFSSIGGSILGAIRLGNEISRQGFDTEVSKTYTDDYGIPQASPGICLSSCLLAFIGGMRRSIDKGSEVGVGEFFKSKSFSLPDGLLGKGVSFILFIDFTGFHSYMNYKSLVNKGINNYA